MCSWDVHPKQELPFVSKNTYNVTIGYDSRPTSIGYMYDGYLIPSLTCDLVTQPHRIKAACRALDIDAYEVGDVEMLSTLTEIIMYDFRASYPDRDLTTMISGHVIMLDMLLRRAKFTHTAKNLERYYCRPIEDITLIEYKWEIDLRRDALITLDANESDRYLFVEGINTGPGHVIVSPEIPNCQVFFENEGDGLVPLWQVRLSHYQTTQAPHSVVFDGATLHKFAIQTPAGSDEYIITEMPGWMLYVIHKATIIMTQIVRHVLNGRPIHTYRTWSVPELVSGMHKILARYWTMSALSALRNIAHVMAYMDFTQNEMNALRDAHKRDRLTNDNFYFRAVCGTMLKHSEVVPIDHRPAESILGRGVWYYGLPLPPRLPAPCYHVVRTARSSQWLEYAPEMYTYLCRMEIKDRRALSVPY
jgi:hypothetical protein